MDSSYDICNNTRDIRMLTNSDIITFIVGPEQRVFRIHADIVSRQSEVLDRMINGGMKESIERVCRLEFVEADTFDLFVNFCYTGQYLVTRHADQKDAKRDPFKSRPSDYYKALYRCIKPSSGGFDIYRCTTCAARVNHNDGDLFPFCKLECQVNTLRHNNWCVNLHCEDAAKALNNGRATKVLCIKCEDNINDGWTASDLVEAMSKNEMYWNERSYLGLFLRAIGMPVTGTEHYLADRGHGGICPSPRLMEHARVYVFAEMYNVEDLKDMILVRLAFDLTWFDVRADNSTDVVYLIEYVYLNTLDKDVLREFVSRFASLNRHKLKFNQKFVELVKAGGDFAFDWGMQGAGLDSET